MVAPKREKMACQRSTTKKKREKGVTMSQKKDRDDSREKTITSRSKQHPSIHPLIHLHLLIKIAWLVSPWIISLTLQYMKCKYALFLSYLELHKSFVVVGKIKVSYCPGKKKTSWVPRESYPGNFAMFSKIFQKVSPDGLQIYEQVSTTLCTVLTLNSPRQGDN